MVVHKKKKKKEELRHVKKGNLKNNSINFLVYFYILYYVSLEYTCNGLIGVTIIERLDITS